MTARTSVPPVSDLHRDNSPTWRTMARPVANQIYDEDRGWHDATDTDVLDLQVIAETEEFIPAEHIWIDVPDDAKPYGRPTPGVPLVSPVGWVPVDPHAGTPVFDAVDACWSWRTIKGRKSRLAMSYAAFVAASRAQHSTWHGAA